MRNHHDSPHFTIAENLAPKSSADQLVPGSCPRSNQGQMCQQCAKCQHQNTWNDAWAVPRPGMILGHGPRFVLLVKGSKGHRGTNLLPSDSYGLPREPASAFLSFETFWLFLLETNSRHTGKSTHVMLGAQPLVNGSCFLSILLDSPVQCSPAGSNGSAAQACGLQHERQSQRDTQPCYRFTDLQISLDNVGINLNNSWVELLIALARLGEHFEPGYAQIKILGILGLPYAHSRMTWVSTTARLRYSYQLSGTPVSLESWEIHGNRLSIWRNFMAYTPDIYLKIYTPNITSYVLWTCFMTFVYQLNDLWFLGCRQATISIQHPWLKTPRWRPLHSAIPGTNGSEQWEQPARVAYNWHMFTGYSWLWLVISN